MGVAENYAEKLSGKLRNIRKFSKSASQKKGFLEIGSDVITRGVQWVLARTCVHVIKKKTKALSTTFNTNNMI